MRMNNLVLRAISGAVYVAVIVLAILGGPLWTGLLMMLFAIAGYVEFHRLSDCRGPRFMYLFTLVCTAIFAVSGFLAIHTFFDVCVLFSIFLFPVLRFCIALFDRSDTALRDTAWDCLGFLYLGASLCSLGIAFDMSESWQFILLFFVLIWLNDTGAYLTGSRFGRTRLCERLSPKKSWEGFWGGMIFCMVAGAIAGHFVVGPIKNIFGGAFLGMVVSIAATLGDLFESALKRHAGVKDSGNLIPGHGGILDRIDSLLFVAPLSLLFTLFERLF